MTLCSFKSDYDNPIFFRRNCGSKFTTAPPLTSTLFISTLLILALDKQGLEMTFHVVIMFLKDGLFTFDTVVVHHVIAQWFMNNHFLNEISLVLRDF